MSKVLFFCNLLPRKCGSFEALLVALAREMAAQGDRIRFAFAGEPVAPVAAALAQSGARWDTIPGWSDGEGREHPWRFTGPSLRLLRREKPDVAVVHFGNELPSLAAALAWRATGARTRWVWQQDQRIAPPTALTARVSRIRLAASAFDAFVAVYDGGARSLARRGVPQTRIHTIFNSVPPYEPSRPRGWLRAALGLSENDVLAVAVGSLIERKRIDFLLDAMAVAADRGTRFHLAVAGDGPLREALAQRARQAGIEARTHFLGLRDDVREVLAEADLFVHAAAAEGSSYAILESMAAGLPAVVTDAGAAREQVVDGQTGWVMDSKDFYGFVDRLIGLCGCAPRRREMGDTARARWRRDYLTETAARRYASLYRGDCCSQ